MSLSMHLELQKKKIIKVYHVLKGKGQKYYLIVEICMLYFKKNFNPGETEFLHRMMQSSTFPVLHWNFLLKLLWTD